MAIIYDGTGAKWAAGVTPEGRLRTSARSINAGTFAALKNELFLVFSGNITLTSSNPSAAIFLKYTGSRQLVLPSFSLAVGQSTGGDNNETDFTIYKNPESISSLNTITPSNRNFNSARTLSGLFYAGEEAATFTGGTNSGTIRLETVGATRQDNESNPIILETNNSIGFTITPPNNNTNASYRIGIFAYEITL